MLDKIDKAIDTLVGHAPQDVIDQFRELRKQAKATPYADLTYDAINILNKYNPDKYPRCRDAAAVFVGETQPYDSRRDR